MAKICITKSSHPDFTVFVTDKEYKADLLVYVVNQDYKAKSDGLWYVVDQDKNGYTKIAYTNNENRADFKIYFVNSEYKAKWQKSNSAQGRL